MNGSVKKAVLAALICAPWLGACTQSPETTFDWGVNDRLPKRQVARNDVTRGDLPRVETRRAKPATAKPRPRAASSKTASAAVYRAPLSQPPRADDPNAPSFVWPVSGPVISDFGGPANGERNDGINIATAMDTPIHAAASGTITYAGNELKDYGNLVLIKHQDGYVTAYAHADRLVVSRGDVVSRGQIIGYAGRSGDVSSPQLHFEIRRDTQPVNPKPLLMARSS
ncbi:MAG: M23 family metallopeptidase [Alphaproteobacteria bacterium]|jgi:murein DD-endopeptidase MepM/ murein hydrolase activator NlpD|nr:M23 family metallopeptidase [Alphaproteobacteria bacterium]